MPIPVTCPGCKAKFTVSEKFAGKEGPCPKCKAKIKVPKLEDVTPVEEVKIHAPEEYTSGPKTVTGRPATKPIARRETRLALVPTVAIVAGVLVTVAAAWLLRNQLHDHLGLRAVALLLVSPPTVRAGYAFLRNDELEPYRGLWLWVRSCICGLVYAGLWGAFYLLPDDLTQEAMYWLFIAPPPLLIGAGAAYVTLDLDFGSGFFHYVFYLLVTLALGYVAGLPMPWSGAASLTL
ncbi:MAG: hypothetical protein WD847_06170 [Pirellulales bacterium]